mgnify:CR=1 FL=1
MLSLSLRHTHTYTHTHTLSLSLSVSLTLFSSASPKRGGRHQFDFVSGERKEAHALYISLLSGCSSCQKKLHSPPSS